MNLKIEPQILNGRVFGISSKSHSHRLLIASALCEKKCDVIIKNTNEDIEATRVCLQNLKSDIPEFPCGESGSTLRFLLPIVAALRDNAIFYGKGRLPQRPLSPLKEEMEKHGVKFESGTTNENAVHGTIVQKIEGRLKAGEYKLLGNVSSQYVTGLLFALPLLGGDSVINMITPLESKGYVDLTLSVLRDFGIKIDEREGNFYIKGNQKYIPPASEIVPEADWSNAAFWICADLISRKHGGTGVRCEGLNEKSLQGDMKITQIVEEIEKVYDTAEIISVDVSQIPDLVPILAVLAAGRRKGITKIVNAARLRIKESDRLSSVFDLITSLGGKAEEYPDALIIFGTDGFSGGIVSGHQDHRIVMAAAIAATMSKSEVEILGAEACAKSYPSFFDDYAILGGRVYGN